MNKSLKPNVAVCSDWFQILTSDVFTETKNHSQHLQTLSPASSLC